MPSVEFSGASVSTPDSTILHPLDLRITEHRVGIIGANGSGKSTLARLINGLTIASSGTVTFDGLDLARQARAVRKQVGFIFSDADSQIVMPTVEEDIAFSLRRHKLSKSEKAARVRSALETVGLTGKEEQSPHLLSGGEKQLLALAAITVLDPTLIVADEPSTLLDLGNRKRVQRLFAEVPQQMIIVTHDLDLVRDADRVICMGDGRVVDDSVNSSPTAVIEAYVDRF